METRVAKLEERTKLMREDMKETDKRLCTIERDVAEIKVGQGKQNTKMDAIAISAEETRLDIKKGTYWVIGLAITTLLGVAVTVLISTLT